MNQWMKRLQTADWNRVCISLNENGFARLPRILSEKDCAGFKKLYDQSLLFRKTIVMERYRFGMGEYKYFGHKESRQPSAVSHQPSAVSHQPSAVSQQPLAISRQPIANSH